MDAAELAGSLVERWAEGRPGRCRRLLGGAWSAVGLAARHDSKETLLGAQDRMNGRIAKMMARSLSHPEDTCTVNIFMPCEPLQAMGIQPTFPEAMAVYVACTRCAPVFCHGAETRGVPESLCSYHKLMLGMGEMGVLPPSPLVANTTVACDANQLSFRRICATSGAPQVVIDVPGRVDDGAVAYVADQLRAMVGEMESVFGTRLDEGELKGRCERSLATLSLVREFMERRGEVSLDQTLTGELCLLIATHTLLGTEEAETYVRDLLDLARRAPAPSAHRRPRLFWVHTLPNWQGSMAKLLDGGACAELVGNDMAYDCLDVIDRLDPGRPYEFMAIRLVHTTSNGAASRRVRAIERQARLAGADGVVVFCHWGCKQTLGIGPLVEERLGHLGLPVLLLDGDGCDPRNVSEGAMTTRLSAFIEQLS